MITVWAGLVLTLLFVIAFNAFLPRRQGGGGSRESIGSRGLVVQVAHALEGYSRAYSRFPTGDGRVIAEILSGQNVEGQNSNHVVFLKFQDQQRYGEKGEILDFWGVPLKYRLTNNSVIVYSFGKNHADDNARRDDIVAFAENN